MRAVRTLTSPCFVGLTHVPLLFLLPRRRYTDKLVVIATQLPTVGTMMHVRRVSATAS